MEIPQLSEKEINEYLALAKSAAKRRYPKIFHERGAEFNRAINFILNDSYMQPHCHPSEEKIEEIWVMRGKMAVIFFDDEGTITKSIMLEKGRGDYIKIPAFAWHTYVIFSDYSISYETMMGVYDPATWKQFPEWAPAENTPGSIAYLNFLKEGAIKE